MTYYDSIAAGYDELHKAEQLKKLDIVVSELSSVELVQGPLLDVGCGTGFSLDILHKKFDRQCIGVDPSQELLKQYTGSQQTLFTGAEHIPLADATCCAVVSITAIQNFDDIALGIIEMRRVAQIGVPIIISCLKRSSKITQVASLLADYLTVEKVIEEDKDLIFFCRRI